MSFLSRYQAKEGKEFAKQVIKSYMKKQKMDTMEEFLNLNSNINDFEQNTKLLNIIRKHGYFIMNEDEYKTIIDELIQEENEKKRLRTEDVNTITINGKEIVTYQDQESGETITVENNVTNRNFEEQMLDVQKDHKQFQSLNDNNTLNVMNYMQEKVKITPDTQHGKDINLDGLSDEDKKSAMSAIAFENKIGHPLDIDLKSKMIYDNGMIYSIEKRGEEYQIISHGEGQHMDNNNTNRSTNNSTKKAKTLSMSNYPKAS